MTTFRKVEPLYIGSLTFRFQRGFLEIVDNEGYVRVLFAEQAPDLLEWLASATGHYPKEPKP